MILYMQILPLNTLPICQQNYCARNQSQRKIEVFFCFSLSLCVTSPFFTGMTFSDVYLFGIQYTCSALPIESYRCSVCMWRVFDSMRVSSSLAKKNSNRDEVLVSLLATRSTWKWLCHRVCVRMHVWMRTTIRLYCMYNTGEDDEQKIITQRFETSFSRLFLYSEFSGYLFRSVVAALIFTRHNCFS